MTIINKSKGTLLADKAFFAQGLLARVVGLLNRKELKVGEALILKPCNSIHTLFMRFPIDVLFVDKDNRIVKTVSSLTPFRLSGIYFRAVFAIELPSGTIKASLTQEGDFLLTD